MLLTNSCVIYPERISHGNSILRKLLVNLRNPIASFERCSSGSHNHVSFQKLDKEMTSLGLTLRLNNLVHPAILWHFFLIWTDMAQVVLSHGFCISLPFRILTYLDARKVFQIQHPMLVWRVLVFLVTLIPQPTT